MSRIQLCRLAAVALLVAAVAAPVAAADFEHPLLERFSFIVGGFFASSDTQLRLDSRDLGLGDRIDFENRFGLDNDETSLELELEWRFRPRHQLRLGYFELDRSATTTIDRELQFGDLTIPVSADVTSTFGTEVLSLSYTYWVVLRERTVFGITAGGVNVVTFDASVGLGQGGVGLVESASADLPVPLVGFELRQALVADKLALHLRAGLIPDISVGDADGNAIDASIALEYRAWRRLALGVAYSVFDLDIDSEKRTFRGNFDYQVTGTNVYVRFGF